MTSAMPALTIAALMALGKQATKKVFEWASSAPDMVRACGEVGRFLNDISAFKKGRKNKNDIMTSLECYMKEHGTTGKEAAASLLEMVDSAWRRMNKAFMEIDRTLLPAVNVAVINQARVIEVVYYGGNDGYT
ncbi:hypothetical protein SORBI_3005G130500 [Sorghum bicolor]|nr:hypothetical protein SORBI_3005G130500 [Sorghum bicolor]